MKAYVYSIDGKAGKEITLPEIFLEEIRPDIINRAAISQRSRNFQPKGTYYWAGVETSAEYKGRKGDYRAMIGTRLPRVKLPKGQQGAVRRVPSARKGRMAHPPKTEKTLVENINRKERRKAIRSAIAATASAHYVKIRGHKIDSIHVPLIVEDKFESMKKAKDVYSFLERLGLGAELIRSEKKTVRAGRGQNRGRAYRRKKGVLIVLSKKADVYKASMNIPGIDVTTAKNLNVELLAPGGNPGRLTVYTESAIKALENAFR